MDSYEWNKIAGWVLAAMASILGISVLTGYMFTPAALESPAYVVEGVEAEGGSGPAADAEPPIAALLASADATRGANQFKKCAACHTIEKGGAQGIGPNLWGIIGARHAHISGFSYSSAMQDTADKSWDWDSLSEWVRNPRSYIPGNKMSFAGISKAQDRADLLLFLRDKADNPPQLPAVPEPEPVEVTPAEAAETPEGPVAEEAAAEAPAEETAA